MITTHAIVSLVESMFSIVVTIVVGAVLWALAASLVVWLRDRFRRRWAWPATEVGLHCVQRQLELVQLKSAIRRDGNRLLHELQAELADLTGEHKSRF